MRLSHAGNRLPTRAATAAAPLLTLLFLAACGSPAVGGPSADAPIPASDGRWSWIDFPNAVCANGETTGLGVNTTRSTTDVVLYMMGGGACWDEQNCVTSPEADFLDGFNSFEFAFTSAFFTSTPLDRTLAGNPFAGANLVFIPYCTGDLHAGDSVNTYGTTVIHHAGHANTEAFLRRLGPTFPGARRIFLVGSSAGGFGAQLNYEAVAAAFPEAEVHLLADGAQLVQPQVVPEPGPQLWDAWKAAWHTPLPAACTGCASDPQALVTYLAETNPDRRFGLLASMQDVTLRRYFGYDGAGFSAATATLLADHYAPVNPNARYFAIDTATHTLASVPGALTSTVGPGGVKVVDWITAWRDGTPAWVNVGP